MDKLAYIKYSQKEANLKIWNSLMDKYKLLKKKNKASAHLWFPLACIFFGFVAVFSWINFFALFFKDIRFTPHYLKTSIETSGMNLEEITQYLDSQYSDYKTKLSFGNISLAKQKQIEATFDILYKQHTLCEHNKQHSEIISNIQTVGKDISNNLSDIKQQTTYISSYTNRKLSEEEELLKRRKEKEQQKVSKYNREKGRNLDSFESTLSDQQINILVKYCNEIPVFNINITQHEMKDILSCTHIRPLQTTINKYIAFLFTRLCEEKLICETWKSVAERHKCFISPNGKDLVSKDLSSANATSGIIKSHIYDLIEECIHKILTA